MKKAAPLDHGKAPRQTTEPAQRPVFKAPLKRRKGLFLALLGVLGLWIVALVILYVRTVYPMEQKHQAPPAASPPSGQTVPR